MILLIIVSAAFGLSIGLYDLLLPLFLDDMGMSYGSMGIIFSFSAIFLFFVRVYAGHISDIVGRKKVFSLSLLLFGICNLFTPFSTNVVPQVILRSLRESSYSIKETLQQLLIFDRWKESFRHIMAWVAGFDATFQGIGTILGGSLLIVVGFRYSFIFSGMLLLLVYILFMLKFKEDSRPVVNKKMTANIDSPAIIQSFSWASPFNHKLSHPLFLLTASGFLLGVGVSMSHAFIAPLFFYHKFAASYVAVSVIIALHRFCLGLPMILAGKIVKWNLKKTVIISIVLQGLFTSLAVVPANFIIAASIWLMHDIVGASVWLPARNTLIQQHARSRSRGLDVGVVLAWQGVGWIFGPLIAGAVSSHSIDYPFLISGVIVALAAVPMFWLK